MQQSPPSTSRFHQPISSSTSSSSYLSSSSSSNTPNRTSTSSTTTPTIYAPIPKDGLQLRGSTSRTPEQQYAFLANPKSVCYLYELLNSILIFLKEKLFLKLIDIG